MFQTIENVHAEKKNLLNRHPDLADVSIIPLAEAGMTLSQVSAFINHCWDHDYGDEAHISFDDDFIGYNLGDLKENRSFLAAFVNDELVGLFVGHDFELGYDNKLFKGSLPTGLSVMPAFRKKQQKNRSGGIAQYLHISGMENYIAQEYDVSVYWVDARHNQPGTSHNIFGYNTNYIQKNTLVSLYGKSLDIEKAAKIGQIKFYERIGARFIQKVLPPQKRNMGQMAVVSYEHADADACLDFMAEFGDRAPARYFETKEALDRVFLFSGRTVRVMTLLLKDRHNCILALLRGFTNPVNLEGDAYFQVDQLLFHPDLTWFQKRDFLSACEAEMMAAGCFAVVVPGNIPQETILKFGYIPVVKQMFGVNFYNDVTAAAIPDIGKIRVELR